ncbi:serine O-acetyltransferase EpsC [Leuconostoc gelidum]|uniref:serine O-acetyltransferase EpsC n=1 Tax=Leuconostoc gelidum TaxID=1244 RepID=UPI000219374B|nr:serine O-acetyltransferase EpsC [Leuconostoc gelidum]AFS39585.1 serine acetyltransferase [Leuconostoc gelidum JB7]MBZ5991665.1 serine acetyltransferase [Leuconostoc gelidum subsp. gelidum]USP17250.1 serine acetyltransferase [Leuconostoc gelidum subsp. aenigmaticum]GMA67167.1 serine acetyltransferase [Leuconostoc gelidum subsp. gelidum]
MFATAKAILKKDPAAHSLTMVILTYPGLHALGYHRLSHWLHVHKHYLLGAIIARLAARRTGVTIAPGAHIGQRVFIDHGIGVVIGETAIIEDDVTILHGVTVGARNITSGRRHPHIKHHSFIGAHAQILGPITIASYSKIGANAVVLNDVPEHATVVGNPARIVNFKLKTSL